MYQRRRVYFLLSYRDVVHYIAVQLDIYLFLDHLEQHEHPDDLYAAGRRRARSSDEHQDDQYHLAERRPQVEVARGITGRRHYSDHLEG